MDNTVTTLPNGTISINVGGDYQNFLPADGLTGFSQHNGSGYGNLTLFLNSYECTVKTCDLSLARFNYIPSIGGNAFFAGLFCLCLFAQLFLGLRYHTRGFMITMLFGLTGEVLGYVGRILLWQQPFDPTGSSFYIYLIPLTIAPAFLTAAIYLCLGRIVVVYGEHLSRIRPGQYAIIFCFCDVVSLVLQAAGGGIASTASNGRQIQSGINTMVAGLSFQVASLILFAGVCTHFALRVYGMKGKRREDTAGLSKSNRFKAFLAGLATSTLVIFIRSVYRIAELAGGFSSPLASSHQPTFMVLEGAMISISALFLTFLHPGVCFQGCWPKASFKVWARSQSVEGIKVNEA